MNHDQQPIDPKDAIYSIDFEGPVYLTVGGPTQEFVIKCFMKVPGKPPVAAHLRFDKEAMGQIFGGAAKLVDSGVVTLAPGEKRVLQ